MGANQSNTAGAGQSATQTAGKEVKTSYYELLAVERDATDEELKKAYRRQALLLHPDRNPNDIPRTTALFQEVRAAYEVLSDPQERAWYDAHEGAILHDIDPEDLASAAAAENGGGSEAYERAIGLTTADDVARMIRRFNGTVEFSDEEVGFYGYLRGVFTQLAKEETFAVKRDGTGAPLDYPTFGRSDSSYENTVRQFYASWAGFSTRKTFSWRDRWRTSDAPDRRTRRMAEKENQRLREDGAREFSEAVRTLVAFVRKRDPRVQGAVGVAKTEEEREKVLREVARERAQKMRRENEEKIADGEDAVPEWARAPTMSKEEEGLEGVVGEEEESEEEQFECVACRKTFKSEKQFEAHEKSKKHLKAVAALRKKLRKEGVELDLDEDDGEEEGVSGVVTPAVEVGDGEGNETNDHHGEGEGEGNEPSDVHSDKEQDVADEGDRDADAESLQDDIDDQKLSHAVQESLENLHIDPLTNDDVDETAHTNDHKEDNSDADAASDSDDSTTSSSPTQSQQNQPQQKLGKAAQKRAKKAAQANAAAGAGAGGGGGTADDLSHKCASCKAAFPSRTRLFQHIKDHGHAAPVPAGGGKKKGKGKR